MPSTQAAGQDVAAAVAALHAAGNDMEALTEAIEQAAFLGDIPGEDRQKLRGTWHIAFDAEMAVGPQTNMSVI